MTMLQDPGFWYAVAFVIFCALAFVFTRKPAASWLDEEIAKIRKELEQARQLRAEAEASLADYQRKQSEALSEAKTIIKRAHEQAAEIKSKAETDLNAALERREKQALNRIRRSEAEATEEIKNKAVDMALALASKTLAALNDDAMSAKLLDHAIDELPKTAPASSKAKAA